MSNANASLEAAVHLSEDAETWADLSNALFDPEEGLVAKLYPTRAEREEFVKTDEYRKIRNLLNRKIDSVGLVNGARPQKSGKFIVRLPRSLHAALEIEASQEGVSLNQLAVTKLAVQLSKLSSGSRPEMAAIVQAFLETRSGFSTDRVVADPDLNRRFLNRCREFDVSGTDFEINWRLFNARKAKHLTDLPKTRRYTASRKDEFEYASEMAIRYVQHKAQVDDGMDISLDRIICDPIYAAIFDQCAQQLAPGFSALQYRWVALGLRKARRLSKAAETVDLPDFEKIGASLDIRPSRIPKEQGVYLIQSGDVALFAGQTDNLRHRIERHFDTAGTSMIPDWLYDPHGRKVQLGIAPLAKVRSTFRRTVELGVIQKHQPLFNYSSTPVAS